MGWSYNQWVGNFYSLDTKPTEYLREYSKYFNSVETNTTFYRLPLRKTVRNWREVTSEDFVFSVKLPRAITHQNLEDSNKLHVFFDIIEILDEKLGPILIQFPSRFKRAEIEKLREFLDNLPCYNRYAVEFRDKSWFNDKTYQLLQDHKISLVHVDHPWIPTTDEITSDFMYIRWHGDRRKVKGDSGEIESDKSENNTQWSKKIEEYLHNNLDVYGYVSKFYSGFPPTDVRELTQLISSSE
jgi:uncharacterized protein YecE (DUF72 family)